MGQGVGKKFTTSRRGKKIREKPLDSGWTQKGVHKGKVIWQRKKKKIGRKGWARGRKKPN